MHWPHWQQPPSLRQAHLHHYTHVDTMEVDDFAQSLESLDSIVADYSQLQQQMDQPPTLQPRLKVVWPRGMGTGLRKLCVQSHLHLLFKSRVSLGVTGSRVLLQVWLPGVAINSTRGIRTYPPFQAHWATPVHTSRRSKNDWKRCAFTCESLHTLTTPRV